MNQQVQVVAHLLHQIASIRHVQAAATALGAACQHLGSFGDVLALKIHHHALLFGNLEELFPAVFPLIGLDGHLTEDQHATVGHLLNETQKAVGVAAAGIQITHHHTLAVGHHGQCLHGVLQFGDRYLLTVKLLEIEGVEALLHRLADHQAGVLLHQITLGAVKDVKVRRAALDGIFQLCFVHSHGVTLHSPSCGTKVVGVWTTKSSRPVKSG